MSNILPIWPGSASFFPGDTPFGFYDNDQDFQCDVENTAVWIGRRLGHGLSDVELQSIHMFSAYEEAVTEYGNQVNTFAARDNLMSLLGFETGSINLSQNYVQPTLRSVLRLSKHYGSEVAAGGKLTYFTGSINVITNKQVYDITEATIERGDFNTDEFTIRKIFHQIQPSLTRFLDPSLGTGLGTQQMMEQFGWGSYSVPGNYLLAPLHADMLRIQAIEFNDDIRKSGYSFQLTGNRLRLFPIPTSNFKLYFNYTLDSESLPGGIDGNTNTGNGKVTDHSNVPYFLIKYKNINEIGRQWIRKYALAVAKEILGYIRGKYSSLPIPDGEITMNADELVSSGKAEKEALITELREMLDQMSTQSQLERKANEADNLAKQLKYIPMKIYVR